MQEPRPGQRQCGCAYKPLPGSAPSSRRTGQHQSSTAKKGGATAAARRLRASRAGRLSTANYRPLPPTTFTATGVQTEFCEADNGHWSHPHRVRFGDILGLHSDSGQLSALHPTTKQAPRWEMAAILGARGEGGNAVEGGKFEVNPVCECSKQRAFSGAVRQVSIGWFAFVPASTISIVVRPKYVTLQCDARCRSLVIEASWESNQEMRSSMRLTRCRLAACPQRLGTCCNESYGALP